jgi:hypothetical protein
MNNFLIKQLLRSVKSESKDISFLIELLTDEKKILLTIFLKNKVIMKIKVNDKTQLTAEFIIDEILKKI